MPAGIDIAKGRWMICKIKSEKLSLQLSESLPPPEEKTLIDIPIGLPESSFRKCDILAKKFLSHRYGSIFMVPVRDAIYAQSYEQALKINRSKAGKGFPKQLWNIAPKIREVDEILRKSPYLSEILIESHPEVCFLKLSGKVLPSKKNPDGIKERIKILSEHLKGFEMFAEKAFEEFPNFKDDVLDSCVLALCAGFDLEFIPKEPERDRFGLPMRIAYPVL